MRFSEAVQGIGTLVDLRRIAGAHVVDHRRLSEEELRAAIVKVQPQYVDEKTVRKSLEQSLYGDADNDARVLSRLILVNVLLEQYDFSLPEEDTEIRVIEYEQSAVDRSNEVTLLELACGDKDSQRFRSLDLYNYVLAVAWENEDSKSPDEVYLLRKLRTRLNISETTHQLLETKLGKYPKVANALHTRSDIGYVRKQLQGAGLLFTIRQDNGVDVDVIPEELAQTLRRVLGIEMRTDSYRQMMTSNRLLRRKEHLTDVLTRQGVEFSRYDTVDALLERTIEYVAPSKAVASSSPTRYGLTSDQLGAWCRDLNIAASGSVEERLARVILHFDRLRPTIEVETDARARWYDFYEELAWRQHDVLREQHVIEKDLEIEAKFEDATRYLFSEKLNHAPLQQRGSDHADGLLSLQSNYLMWDNKSKESSVSLKDHVAQFDAYMNRSDKPVPVFLVIGPDFTQESETEAVRYHASHMDRNLVLISATDLKRLAEEWASGANRKGDEPFPLGLLAATGRFDRKRLGKLW